MAYEWLNTVGRVADTVGSVGNALSPFLNMGGAIYDRNNTRSAINAGFDQYASYANNSLNTLRNTFNQGRRTLQPYLRAGREGLSGYQNLLRDPSQITDDPGYQFRLDQGAEGMRRQLAAGGFRGSGNSAIALTQYGQDYASNEFDKALTRYMPMINAGQTATGQLTELGRNYAYGVTGINNALGEAAAGREIGNAGADSRLVTDFLGMTGGTSNPFSAAADAAGNLRSAATFGREVGNLATAGGGNPLAAGAESLRQAGQGTWADPFAGPRTAARMPTTTAATGAGSLVGTGGITAGSIGAMNALGGTGTAASVVGAPVAAPYAGGYAMQDTVAAMDALGAGAEVTGSAANAATPAASLGAQATGQIGMGTAIGFATLPMFVHGIEKMARGGSVESAKSSKFAQQLQRDIQSDPTGRAAQNTISRLINNQIWPGEGNQWVVQDLMKSGTIDLNNPALYSSKSVMDIFGSPQSLKSAVEKGQNSQFYGYARSFGLNNQQASQYEAAKRGLAQRTTKDSNGYDRTETYVRGPNGQPIAQSELWKQQVATFERSMTPEARLRTATTIRDQILAQNPRADVTKLNQFIRSAR